MVRQDRAMGQAFKQLRCDGRSVQTIAGTRSGTRALAAYRSAVTFDDALDVATLHKNVDLLERRFRRQYPGVVRVVGHAEPRFATILSQARLT